MTCHRVPLARHCRVATVSFRQVPLLETKRRQVAGLECDDLPSRSCRPALPGAQKQTTTLLLLPLATVRFPARSSC